MEKIAFILFLIFLLFNGCSKSEILYVPIINHTDFAYYLTINVNNNTAINNFKIEKLSVSEIKFKVKIDDYSNVSFLFMIKETSNSHPMIKDILWFPGGGIVSNSSRGGFFVAIDIIFNKNGRIKVLYSEDAFKYGFPTDHSLTLQRTQQSQFFCSVRKIVGDITTLPNNDIAKDMNGDPPSSTNNE